MYEGRDSMVKRVSRGLKNARDRIGGAAGNQGKAEPHPVIPGRSQGERTRNLEIPGSMLRIAPK
jgi:hypothetical protein